MDVTTKQTEKYIQMTHQPVNRLVRRLAVPTIICMMVTSLYNIVDTIFVGQLSTASVAAVGVCYSFMVFVQAFGYFFAQGSGNYIARIMGAHDFSLAEQMAAFGFFLSVGFGGVVSLLSGIFLKPLAFLLGAYPEILQDTLDYLRLITLGAPFFTGSIVLNLQLRFQGNAVRSVVGITSGAIVNVLLDPLLIFGFDLGITGAALATLIGQIISFLVLCIQMECYGVVKIRLRSFVPSRQLLVEVFRGGTPSFFRQSMGSFSAICLNLMARDYGTAVVAAFSAVSRVMNLATAVINGFGQGFQPVCGFNYGAKLYKRVKDAFLFSLRVEFTICVVFSILGLLFAESIIGIIRDDAAVIQAGAAALRIQCITFPFISLVAITNMTTQVMGRVGSATIQALSRQGLFFIPAVLLLPRLFGFWGIAFSQSASDICATIISILILRSVWRELSSSRILPV